MPGYCRYKEIIDQVYGVDELVIDKNYMHTNSQIQEHRVIFSLYNIYFLLNFVLKNRF